MKWRDIAEAVGVTAIVASLIFVGVQLRQDRQIAETELLATQQLIGFEFARLAQERPEIWRKGLAGDPLSQDEQVSFDLIAYALFRYFANENRRQFVFQGETIGGDPGSATRIYAFFVYANPGLRAWFDRLVEGRASTDRAYGLPDDLRFFPSGVADRLQQLDESQPELPEPRPYPF